MARCCSYYDDFGYRHKRLVDRLLSQGYEVKRLRNSLRKFYGRYPDLIVKYQRSLKDMTADSFPDYFNVVVQLFFTFFIFNTDFVTFYQLMLVVAGVMHEADNAYSIRNTWLCYRPARFLITRQQHLLIVTADLSHFTDLLGMSFSLLLHFLPVLSLETNVCSILKFYPAVSGVIMSIR